MAGELAGKVAAVTGAASGIGLASSEAMLALGARVVMVDRDEAALKKLSEQARRGRDPAGHQPARRQGLRDAWLPRILEKAGQLDILHANAGLYVGGDLVDADTMAIDRMLNLNVNVVMKNVHDALPHMIGRGTGDIIVTSSLAAHFPTPWEPVYASSKWAINCFVQTVRRQVFKHGIRVGSISPGPVITALIADWPPEKLKEAKESGSLLEASEVANVVTFMLTRPRGMTIRDVGDDADQFRSLGRAAAWPPIRRRDRRGSLCGRGAVHLLRLDRAATSPARCERPDSPSSPPSRDGPCSSRAAPRRQSAVQARAGAFSDPCRAFPRV